VGQRWQQRKIYRGIAEAGIPGVLIGLIVLATIIIVLVVISYSLT
jgi:tetrahydromethanopterin S-methyltransferase subunit F